MMHIPLNCMDMGNIRVGLSSMDRASVCQVLASLPIGSFRDVKEENFTCQSSFLTFEPKGSSAIV